ncbi:MAG: hypothetical protein GC154_11450 [bacterium]|nr:hypothetical protein [bacterium]
MSNAIFNPGVSAEKRHLLLGGCALAIAASVLLWLTGWRVLPSVMYGLAALQLLGCALYPVMGRNVFLLFTLVGYWMSGVISWVTVRLMYLFAIVLIGNLLRLFGMNRLERNFQSCRARDTLFVDAPDTDLDSFGRQS